MTFNQIPSHYSALALCLKLLNVISVNKQIEIVWKCNVIGHGLNFFSSFFPSGWQFLLLTGSSGEAHDYLYRVEPCEIVQFSVRDITTVDALSRLT